MFRCKSRKHVWTLASDAQRCCNGYTRCLGIHRREYVTTSGVMMYGSMYRYWQRDMTQAEDEQFQPERVNK